MRVATIMLVGGAFDFAQSLQVIFIALKLASVGAISNWSWWLVFGPAWALLAFLMAITFIAALVAAMRNPWRR